MTTALSILGMLTAGYLLMLLIALAIGRFLGMTGVGDD